MTIKKIGPKPVYFVVRTYVSRESRAIVLQGVVVRLNGIEGRCYRPLVSCSTSLDPRCSLYVDSTLFQLGRPIRLEDYFMIREPKSVHEGIQRNPKGPYNTNSVSTDNHPLLHCQCSGPSQDSCKSRMRPGRGSMKK